MEKGWFLLFVVAFFMLGFFSGTYVEKEQTSNQGYTETKVYYDQAVEKSFSCWYDADRVKHCEEDHYYDLVNLKRI